MSAAIVDIATFSDADFARAFQWMINDVPFDFTGFDLLMMVRREPEDAEVFISLSSIDDNGILFQPDEAGNPTTFNIYITREQTAAMPPGTYVHSLILLRPDGLRDDIWRGTLTHAIGPTR